MKAKLIFNTIRHMNNRQIRYRIKYEIDKKISRKISKKEAEEFNENYIFYKGLIDKEYFKRNFEIDLDNVNKILDNNFKFLNNLEYKFMGEIDWKENPFNYRLWNFNLNYFNYLDSLNEATIKSGENKYIYKGLELILKWIKSNEKYDINIWDPYVASNRVFNWINFVCYNKCEINEEKLKIINNSIATHANFIYRHIEYYLDCNHILMDAKALLACGIYLNNKKYIKKSCDILNEEFERQFFSDGFHYENSPSYQIEVLDNYLSSYLLLINNNLENYSNEINLHRKCKVISQALYRYCNKEGEIALLNDSSLDYPFKASDILQVSSILFDNKLKKKSGSNISKYMFKLLGTESISMYFDIKSDFYEKECLYLAQNKYAFIQDNNLELIYDCADGGPDYNLGHTHADSLNIIMRYKDKDILIDSGTYTYKKCKERNVFRSTSYHNTIEIDGKSSSEIWSAFRVAKRAKSYITNVKESDDYVSIEAFHDGYSKVLDNDKIYHKRNLIYIKGKGIVIVDNLYGHIKENHKFNINYNIPCDIEKIENGYMINKNLFFSSNIEFNMRKRQASKKFNILYELNNLYSEIEFNKEYKIITIIEFEKGLLKLDADKVIISNSNYIMEV